MQVQETGIAGAYLVVVDTHDDERGSLWKPFSAPFMRSQGMSWAVAEVLAVRNLKRLTLRGMHWQQRPMGQAKNIAVVRGSVWDAIVDLRPESRSYRQVFWAVLDGRSDLALHVPAGCAHGYLTLEDDTEVIYTLSQARSAANERGLRYDDPWARIPWPEAPLVVSSRDLEWPPFDGEGGV